MRTFDKINVIIWLLVLSFSVTLRAQENTEKYYSLLYQKSMIPKPDSVQLFQAYLAPYDATTFAIRSYRNFALGATYSNLIPKHTFGFELSLPYTGRPFESFRPPAGVPGSTSNEFKYISKGYINKKYRLFRIQANWKYLLKVNTTPYIFYAYKNAPRPNDSVPVLEGIKQERFYLRGGLNFQVTPNFIKLTFPIDAQSSYDTLDNGYLLHKNRAFTFNIGFERQKEHYTSTSVDRIKFQPYHKMKHFYADILFQPFMGLGKLEVLDLDTVPVLSNGQVSTPTSQPMSDEMRKYIKSNVIKLNSFGLRVGYGWDYIFNSPIGIELETGVMTGVNRNGAILGSLYTKIRLKVDINLPKRQLRTDGIVWD